MPLNYSKWDKLELSDDSDIEGHPNVDHRSLVNWKKRDIHEKRAMRNQKIRDLKAEIACNDVLLPRLRTITEEVHGAPDGPAQFSRIVEQLKTNPSSDAPKTDPNAPHRLSYDEMILSLLLQVYDDAKAKGVDKNNAERLREVLIANLKGHVAKLGERQEELKKELEKEEEEKSKKITSESLHDGWDSHYVPPKPEPKPVKGSHPTKTEKKTDIEVLNSKSLEAAEVANLAAKSPPPRPASNDDDDDDSLPEMTPVLEEFSHLPLKGYEQSFHFIQAHRDVYVPGASDALLVAAFTAQRADKPKYAKQCVHQSLLIQYCEKLGPDGVRLFFKRMTAGDPRADAVFSKDVEDTYGHIVSRVKAARDEEAARGVDENGEVEQIQLVPESAGQQISFVIPDGPPPENLHLEGPGTENLDIEEVRKALQMRWDVFQGFPEHLKEALRQQSLDAVNKVLGKMKVSEAEEVVGLLDNAGILNFADGGIRDETGREPLASDDDDGGDEADGEAEDVEEPVKQD